METENITSASTFICSEAESTSTTEEKPSLSNKSSTEFSENARPAPTQPWKQWKSLVEKNNDGPWVGWQPEPDKGVQKPWLDWIRYYHYPEQIFGPESSVETEMTPEDWETLGIPQSAIVIGCTGAEGG